MMGRMNRAFIGATVLALMLFLVPVAYAVDDVPVLRDRVAAGTLPPVDQRLPATPLQIDFKRYGLELGRYGGTINMLMAKSKDTRQMTVYGYARLVGYAPDGYAMEPDILESIDVHEGRVFTFRLRQGHKWSDGQPFTAEDFRYWWEDVANDQKLSPAGPPSVMKVDGEPPVFEVLDERTVRYAWALPNPDFLPRLAGASPLYLYRPAHYLKQFHAKFAEPEKLAAKVKSTNRRNWASLHNKKDNLYRNDNPALPVLQPWVVVTKAPAERFVFTRNPFFHRVDPMGRQLPYADQVVLQLANSKLISAKTGTGESDLQARYLRFDDYTFLKQGEDRFPYDTRLWRTAKGAHLALYPNLNANDPVWRKLLRDVRTRRALSLAINRHEINQVIYFGLAYEGNNTVLPSSPLFRPEYRDSWTQFDRAQANRLLDEIGLTKRDSRGVRLMPDGRPMEIVVETAGESTEQTDVLQLIHDGWMDIGIKLFTRPSQRTVFRSRIFAGDTLMSIWFGVENGLATPDSSPSEFAPTSQSQLQWPKWGQFLETSGRSGLKIDMPVPKQLMTLYVKWRRSRNSAEREDVWRQMLAIHADQVYSLGLISGVLQPVVVSETLHNVPKTGIYNWDPGAHFGIYRPDTFWFSEQPKKSAALPGGKPARATN